MNTSLGPGWPTQAMIGSGRTRARIEQTVGNICEISIGLRAAKDPGRSNALPKGAILIHRVMGTMLSLWSWAYSIQASCNCFRLLGKQWTGLSASHDEQFDQRKSLSPRLGFRERVSGSVFASRFHFFASTILSAGSAARIAITAMTTSSSMRVNAKPWAALLAGTEQIWLRGFMANPARDCRR